MFHLRKCNTDKRGNVKFQTKIVFVMLQAKTILYKQRQYFLITSEMIIFFVYSISKLYHTFQRSTFINAAGMTCLRGLYII